MSILVKFFVMVVIFTNLHILPIQLQASQMDAGEFKDMPAKELQRVIKRLHSDNRQTLEAREISSKKCFPNEQGSQI